jgi:hypothetical protein
MRHAAKRKTGKRPVCPHVSTLELWLSTERIDVGEGTINHTSASCPGEPHRGAERQSQGGLMPTSEETPREATVPFKYVDFYDVPRLIILRYRSFLFLLASYFDEKKDDHDDYYTIFILPSWVEQKIAESSWRVIEQDIGARRVGTVQIANVVFDDTKRKSLDPTFLDEYFPIGKPGTDGTFSGIVSS